MVGGIGRYMETGFSDTARERLHFLALAAAIAGAVALLYFRPGGFDYVAYDDDLYIYENDRILQGLSVSNAKWAMTAEVGENWHPMTLISYMIDVELFGPDPGAQHLVNLLMHALNSVLLFFALFYMTSGKWAGFLVAVLFAVHPLHVESVAWISERKDLLSTFFMLLTIVAYVRYVRTSNLWTYCGSAFLFLLALMSKPMVVTLPVLLLLLDVWPLNRLSDTDDGQTRTRVMFDLIKEKLPLFLMSLICGAITIQYQSGAEINLAYADVTFLERMANAFNSYVVYLIQTVWPFGLAVFYPHPGKDVSFLSGGLSLIVLLALSALAYRNRRLAPWFAVGWLWFLVALLPVIGIMLVGGQAHADRYVYIPHIGLFVGLIWLALPLFKRQGLRRGIACFAMGLIVVGFSVQTWRQVSHWRDSETLFLRALNVAEDNENIRIHLGVYYMTEDRTEEAREHFTRAVELNPESVHAHTNLGTCLRNLGDVEGAIASYEMAIAVGPTWPQPHAQLGALYYRSGDVDFSISSLRRALELDPDYKFAHVVIANAYAQKGDWRSAVRHMEEVLRLDPYDQEAANRLDELRRIMDNSSKR